MQDPDLPGSTLRYLTDDNGQKWISSQDLLELLDMSRFTIQVQALGEPSDDEPLQFGVGAIVGYVGHLTSEIKYLIEEDEEEDILDDIYYGEETA